MFPQWPVGLPPPTRALGDKARIDPIPAASADEYEIDPVFGGAGSALGLVCLQRKLDTAVDVACFLAEMYAEYNYTQRSSPSIAVPLRKEMEWSRWQ